MRRLITLVLSAALMGGGGWYVKNHHAEILDKILVTATSHGDSTSDPSYGPPAAHTARADGTIRVASFNIQAFGEKKISKPRVRAILAEIVRQFDVVAIQEIRSKNDILPQFLEVINSSGRRYDYVLGPREGRTVSQEQYAFLFDTSTIEVDRLASYVVADPDDIIHREPYVGWFRVRGPAANQAFTFSLVNIHTDPDKKDRDRELDALADVFKAVRNDGRNEDDVIILGDLNASDRQLGRLGRVPHIHCAISDVPTNTHGNQLYDNIIFDDQATSEYSNRWGVLDVIREFNLTMDEALEVSDHFPVWAEFSAFEGGRGGRVATRPFNPSSR